MLSDITESTLFDYKNIMLLSLSTLSRNTEGVLLPKGIAFYIFFVLILEDRKFPVGILKLSVKVRTGSTVAFLLLKYAVQYSSLRRWLPTTDLPRVSGFKSRRVHPPKVEDGYERDEGQLEGSIRAPGPIAP